MNLIFYLCTTENTNNMKKSTLNDISERTGLSVTTISRVLNGKSEEFRISKSSQEIIMKAVRELNYRPNFVAQGLRNSSTHTIGLLVPGIDNPFFANIANAVINEAHKYTYPVMIIDTHESPKDEDQAIDTLLSRNVDGIIMVPSSDSPARLMELAKEKPLVLIDRYFDGYDLPYVATDNYRGAIDATNLLLDAGHKDIMCIQGTPQSVTSRRRVQGYMDALSCADLTDRAIVCGNEFSVQNGYVETKLALNSGMRFSAIFALSNTILLGAVKAISEHGLSIPGDVSIVSFDDNLYLDYLNPPVTRISQPIESISMVAVKMLMDRILGTNNSPGGILLQPSVVYRSSVGAFRPSADGDDR